MKLKYEELIKEKGLLLDELPARAKLFIKAIKQWLAAIHLAEKSGKKTNPELTQKIEASDDWVCIDINNYIAGKSPIKIDDAQTGPSEAEKEAARLAAEKAEQEEAEKLRLAAEKEEKEKKGEGDGSKTPAADPRGKTVDEELKVLLNAGKASLTLQELKESAKATYDIIFDAYEVDGENGIETSHYRLVEVSKEVFALTKK